MSADLASFLLQRIAEDEAAARAWRRAYDDPGSHPAYHRQVTQRHRAEWPVLWRSLDRFPPARILGECEAKREIVDEHTAAETPTICPVCHYQADYEMLAELEPCRTLRLLAQPYSSHPDYDPAWRP